LLFHTCFTYKRPKWWEFLNSVPEKISSYVVATMLNSNSPNQWEFICSLHINKPNSSAGFKEMWRLRKENWLLSSKKEKKVKMKFIYLDHARNDKLLNRLLLSLGCWLMLARMFCVYNAGLKVDKAWEILTVNMTSNDENVSSCKRHTVVRRGFCFWQSLCPSWSRNLLPWVLICTCMTYRGCIHSTYYSLIGRVLPRNSIVVA